MSWWTTQTGGGVADPADTLPPDPEIFSMYHPQAMGNILMNMNPAGFAPTSGAVEAANLAGLYPFRVNYDYTVKLLWLQIGAGSAGNVDVGIYNNAFAKVVSAGSTAAGTADTVQVFDVGDVVLTAGAQYFFAAVASTQTTLRIVQRSIGSSARFQASGCAEQSSALPLPDPFVPAAGVNSSTVYSCGFSNRTAFV